MGKIKTMNKETLIISDCELFSNNKTQEQIKTEVEACHAKKICWYCGDKVFNFKFGVKAMCDYCAGEAYDDGSNGL
jgi:Zn finger protein HypA/HybF involved in hydrogenase expression